MLNTICDLLTTLLAVLSHDTWLVAALTMSEYRQAQDAFMVWRVTVTYRLQRWLAGTARNGWFRIFAVAAFE